MYAVYAFLRIRNEIHQTHGSLQLNVIAVQSGHKQQSTIPLVAANEGLSHCRRAM